MKLTASYRPRSLPCPQTVQPEFTPAILIPNAEKNAVHTRDATEIFRFAQSDGSQPAHEWRHSPLGDAVLGFDDPLG